VVGGASADDGGRIASVSVSAAGAVAAAHSSYLLALVGCTARGGLAFWSGGDDRVIRRWAAHPDTPLGPPAQTIQALSAVLCLSLLPSGDLISGGEDGVARVWSSDPARVADAAVLESYEGRASAAAAAAAAAAGSSGGGAGASSWAASQSAGGCGTTTDFSFPVQLPGRPEMIISWSRGESVAEVAARFVEANSLGQHHLADVAQFVTSAMGMTQTAMAQTQSAAAAGSEGAQASSPQYDFEYPVELDRGGALSIRWNRGETAEAVAQRFLLEHRLSEDNRPDIIAFVNQVRTVTPRRDTRSRSMLPPCAPSSHAA
jgi:hypothetical protein